MVEWAAPAGTLLTVPASLAAHAWRMILHPSANRLPMVIMTGTLTKREWGLSGHFAFPAAKSAIIPRCPTRPRIRSVHFIYKSPASGARAPADISCLFFHGEISLFPEALGEDRVYQTPSLGASLAAFSVTGDHIAPRGSGSLCLSEPNPIGPTEIRLNLLLSRSCPSCRRKAKEVASTLCLCHCPLCQNLIFHALARCAKREEPSRISQTDQHRISVEMNHQTYPLYFVPVSIPI